MNPLERLLAAVVGLPDDASVSFTVSSIREMLGESREQDSGRREPPGETHTRAVEWTWREKLWACPAETRLGVEEVCEALGKSNSWIYKRTTEVSDSAERLPARRMHGQLVFTAGELRTWVREHEDVIEALLSTAIESCTGLAIENCTLGGECREIRSTPRPQVNPRRSSLHAGARRGNSKRVAGVRRSDGGAAGRHNRGFLRSSLKCC